MVGYSDIQRDNFSNGAPSFSSEGERMIYRELFLKGLTLLDMPIQEGRMVNASHNAARGEVAALLRTVGVLQTQAA